MRKAFHMIQMRKGNIDPKEYRQTKARENDIEEAERNKEYNEKLGISLPLLNYNDDNSMEIKFNKKRYEKMQNLGRGFDGIELSKLAQRRDCCKHKS